MRIFNVGNNSVNLYLLDSGTHRLLIDSGFPGQLPLIGRELRKNGLRVQDIDFLMVTHFHVDHAGEIQAFKNQGVRFLLVEIQAAFIEPMEKMISSKWKNYLKLINTDNTVVSITQSRAVLKNMNINGELVHTTGHSNDSLSLALDSGEAFTGDLPPAHLLTDVDIEAKASWMKLKQLNIKTVYPGHGSSYDFIKSFSYLTP